jgi:hypothetical protein
MWGVGTSGVTPIWAGLIPKESASLGVTLDGGSASDYRLYTSLASTSHPSGDPVYSAPGGGINGSVAYYAGFGGEAAPAAQIALYPGQTGVTDPGEIAFAWRAGVIDVLNNLATFSIDGLSIASIDLTTVSLGGSNIFFGHGDTNAGLSSDPNSALLNITLIDNVRVTAIPEPSTLALAGLGIAGLLLVRRRR